MTSEDPREGARWLRRSADQGHLQAQTSLASLHLQGKGVERSESEAMLWLGRAAAQGHAVAQATLGTFYLQGEQRGTPEDLLLAYMWLDVALPNLESTNAEQARTDRQKVSGLMKVEQIERAQELSRKCLAQNYRNCGA